MWGKQQKFHKVGSDTKKMRGVMKRGRMGNFWKGKNCFKGNKKN